VSLFGCTAASTYGSFLPEISLWPYKQELLMEPKLTSSQRLSCPSLDRATPGKRRDEASARVSGIRVVAVALGVAAALPRAFP